MTFRLPSDPQAVWAPKNAKNIRKHRKCNTLWWNRCLSLGFSILFVKNSEKHCRFLRFCCWLFKKHIKTCCFLWCLICDCPKSWYFIRRVQKMLRHIDGIIEKTCICLVFLIRLKWRLSKIVKKTYRFLRFRSITPMELLKFIHISFVFWYFWIHEIKKQWFA